MTTAVHGTELAILMVLFALVAIGTIVAGVMYVRMVLAAGPEVKS